MPVLPPVPPRIGVVAAPSPPVPIAPALAAPPLAAPPAGAPLPPGGAPVPPMLQAPPPPPVTPDAPPAEVHPQGKLRDRGRPQDETNSFTRQAMMIVDMAQDWAKRMAENLGDHPADSSRTDPETVHEMFHFSPYGLDAPARFWQIHDELLQTAMHANDPDPYAVAERGALDEVYPYRAQIGLLDSLGPEERVTRAEQLLAISHNEIAKGNPHDALPSLVGPAGRPGPDEEPPAR